MNSGILYLISTPIGNLGDISQRALTILSEVDLIAVEDTRHSARLLNHYQISTKKMALHAHNEAKQSKMIVEKLLSGASIALISDAGTPLISDPGFALVRMAQENNIKVSPVPGACAAIAALSASGMPADRFVFEGFLPAKTIARQHRLQAFVNETRTVIFYEAPHRIIAMLEDVKKVFGDEREVAIARELTKQFETIHRDQVAPLIEWMQKNKEQQKGEFVVLLHGAGKTGFDEVEARRVLELLLPHMSVKQAAKIAAEITGFSKNKLYELAI